MHFMIHKLVGTKKGNPTPFVNYILCSIDIACKEFEQRVE